MNFSFTEEQQMIRESCAKFLAQYSDSAAVRRAMNSKEGYDRDVWQRLCRELELHALLIPESYSGLGLGFVEACCVLEEMGRRLYCGPYLNSCIVATMILRICADAEQQADYFARLLAAEVASVAMPHGFQEPMFTFTVSDECYHISGCQEQLMFAASADWLLLCAQHQDTNEKGFFIVDAHCTGITLDVKEQHCLDKTRAMACVRANRLPLERGAFIPLSTEQLSRIQQIQAVALAAEQCGGAQAVLALALDYAAQRHQFARPISSFQAVKHKAADMQLACELSISAVYSAACMIDAYLQNVDMALQRELWSAADIAKVVCSESFYKNAGMSIQIMGGVAITWEYDTHLYFKRAKASQLLLGRESQYRERIAQYVLA